MRYIVEDLKTGEEVYTSTDDKYILKQLTAIFWGKYIIEQKGYKKHFNYNYSDRQRITFIRDNCKYIFEDIPTSWRVVRYRQY